MSNQSQPLPENSSQPSEPQAKPAVPRLPIKVRKPHSKQQLFIDSKAKRKIIRAGRRGGKTTGIAILALIYFANGHRVLYAAPTQDQLKKFWFEIVHALAPYIEKGLLYKNETEHIIEVAGTQNRIRAKTAWNADTLRGDYADVLILDEFQLMAEDTWGDVGAPMLIDNNGDAIFIYTPPSLHSKSVTKAVDPRHAAKLYEKAKADKSGRWETFHFTSYDNPHVSAAGLQEVMYDMTEASKRREIMAEDSKDFPGSLWKQELIDATRISIDQLPVDLEVVVIGVDPTGSSTNEAGIVATAKGPAPKGWEPSPEILKKNPKVMEQKHGYVIADASLLAPAPEAWAAASVNLYFDKKADVLLGERNYGGDMVASTIRQAERGHKVNFVDANATRGKMVRAEPVAAAFGNGVFHVVGVFPELEDEMTSYVPGNPSPNRMDAMVWGGLRIVEGLDVNGLVEFFNSGMSETIPSILEQKKVPVISGAAKVDLPKERCPNCDCLTCIPIPGGQKRCMECGHQFGTVIAEPKAKTRTEMLNDGNGNGSWWQHGSGAGVYGR